MLILSGRTDTMGYATIEEYLKEKLEGVQVDIDQPVEAVLEIDEIRRDREAEPDYLDDFAFHNYKFKVKLAEELGMDEEDIEVGKELFTERCEECRKEGIHDE